MIQGGIRQAGYCPNSISTISSSRYHTSIVRHFGGIMQNHPLTAARERLGLTRRQLTDDVNKVLYPDPGQAAHSAFTASYLGKLETARSAFPPRTTARPCASSLMLTPTTDSDSATLAQWYGRMLLLSDRRSVPSPATRGLCPLSGP